jgi:quercetin dioxygenase-like cupin family protein
MNLEFEKEVEDVRGKIVFYKYGDKRISIVEIKKGYARGGHYHKSESEHILVSGKIEYKETDVKTGKETTKIFLPLSVIRVLPNMAHLLIAVEDTVFIEIFDDRYESTTYIDYRNIVEEKMKLNM